MIPDWRRLCRSSSRRPWAKRWAQSSWPRSGSISSRLRTSPWGDGAGRIPPGPGLADEVLAALIDHPEGIWTGRSFAEHNLAALGTPDKRIDLLIPGGGGMGRGHRRRLGGRGRSKRTPEYPLDPHGGESRGYHGEHTAARSCLEQGPPRLDSVGESRGCGVSGTGRRAEGKSNDRGRKRRHRGGGNRSGATGSGDHPPRIRAESSRERPTASTSTFSPRTPTGIRIAGTPYHRYVPCKVEGLCKDDSTSPSASILPRVADSSESSSG